MARYGDGTKYGTGAKYGDRNPIVKQLTDIAILSVRCYQFVIRRRC